MHDRTSRKSEEIWTTNLHRTGTQREMAALIPDENKAALATWNIFFTTKMQPATTGTSAATYKLMDPLWPKVLLEQSSLGTDFEAREP